VAAARREVAAQVAGPAGEVEHPGAGWDAEGVDRPLAPPPVEAQRDDAVHAVVPGREAIEHLLDRVVLGVDLRARTVVSEHGCVSEGRSQPGSSLGGASSLGSPTASRCSCATSSRTLRKWLATRVVTVGRSVRKAATNRSAFSASLRSLVWIGCRTCASN